MGEAVVNLYEAKTQLSKLVERAAAGEEIVIAKAGRPRARLVPLAGPSKLRRPGGWKGKAWIAEDFDDPLPPENPKWLFGRGMTEPRCGVRGISVLSSVRALSVLWVGRSRAPETS